MQSKPERIAARIVALLTNATDAGANIWRDRDDAFTREESPAILIELGKEDSTPLGSGRPGFHALDMNELDISVIVCVRGADWQTVADAVRVQTFGLMAGDPTLRGLVASLRRVTCEWRAQAADQPFGYAAQIYRAKYTSRTDRLDLDP